MSNKETPTVTVAMALEVLGLKEDSSFHQINDAARARIASSDLLPEDLAYALSLAVWLLKTECGVNMCFSTQINNHLQEARRQRFIDAYARYANYFWGASEKKIKKNFEPPSAPLRRPIGGGVRPRVAA